MYFIGSRKRAREEDTFLDHSFIHFLYTYKNVANKIKCIMQINKMQEDVFLDHNFIHFLSTYIFITYIYFLST